MIWGINAYNHNYDIPIHFRDVNNLDILTKDNLNTALCEFILKFTIQQGEVSYPPRTWYHTICAMHKHLINVNGNF